MRSKSRAVAVLAILNACILVAGVTGAVSLRGDQASQASGEGIEPAQAEQGSAESESPGTAETTAPPPTPDLTPAGIAESAALTLEQPARFTMRVDLVDYTWRNSEAPVRSADVEGVMDGDRLQLTMEADYPFPDTVRVGYRERTPSIVVLHAWEIATSSEPTVFVTRAGSDIWICGAHYRSGCWQLPNLESWEPSRERKTIESLKSYVLAIMPFMHLEGLRGATEVLAAEDVELDGVPVHHVTGTLTIGQALAGLPMEAERQLRWWYLSLSLGHTMLDRIEPLLDSRLEKPYPFEVWIDSDGLIRRATVSVSVDFTDVYPSPSAVTEAGYHPDHSLIGATVTMDLHDLGGEFEFSPPADFRTWPPPPPDVDPRYLEELNIEDEMPMFEEWLRNQGG